MKRMLLVLSALLLTVTTRAQFLNSHLEGWYSGGACQEDCATFDEFYVPDTYTPASPRWRRIGSPHRIGTSEVHMWAVELGAQSGEGLFAAFPFAAGKQYKIRVGISSSNHQFGKLRFYAMNNLKETPFTFSGGGCQCGEDYIETDSRTLNSYWESNGGVTHTPAPTYEHIARITPGSVSSLVEKFLLYTPAASHSQFVMHAAGVPNSSFQYQVVIDYIIIEEVCDADFGYILNTANMLDVEFDGHISSTPAVSASWDMGDGNTASGIAPTHSYAAYGDYKVCLESSYSGLDGWGCKECKDVCVNEPQRMEGDGPPPDLNVPDPTGCNNSDFKLFVTEDGRDVGLSPASGSQPYYVVDWGDGTVISAAGIASSWGHTYPAGAPGSTVSYTVCLETGLDCKTCLDICLYTPLPDPVDPDDRDRIEGEDRLFQASGITADPGLNLESIAPNPANTETVLSVNTNSEKEATIIVTDLAGKVVLKTSQLLGIGKNYITLSVADLEKGLYLVEISADGKSIKDKFVKQ